MENTKIMYAQKCTATGEGMNKGFVTYGAENFFKYKSDLVAHILSWDCFHFYGQKINGKKATDVTEDELLNFCEQEDLCYYYEWDSYECNEWEEINGELIEIPEEIINLAFAKIQQEQDEKIQKILSISKPKPKYIGHLPCGISTRI